MYSSTIFGGLASLVTTAAISHLAVAAPNHARDFSILPREATGFAGCSNSQKSVIQQALADAATLASWVGLKMNDRSSNA